MARPHRTPKALRLRRRCRSRWRHRHPLWRPSQAPILANIDTASRPRRSRSDPPMCIPPTGAAALQRAGNRKTHRSAPGARGFLLWRISYAKRRPISSHEGYEVKALSGYQPLLLLVTGSKSEPLRIMPDRVPNLHTTSHTVAARSSCTIIPLAAGKGSSGRDHSSTSAFEAMEIVGSATWIHQG